MKKSKCLSKHIFRRKKIIFEKLEFVIFSGTYKLSILDINIIVNCRIPFDFFYLWAVNIKTNGKEI